MEKSNTTGLTPLIIAAGKDNLDAVKELLAAGANSNAISYVCNFSALAAATTNGHDEIIHELVKGADVNRVSRGGLDVLSVAAESGNLGSVKLLLDFGARPSQKMVYNAELQKRYDIVEYLLSIGMDVNFFPTSISPL